MENVIQEIFIIFVLGLAFLVPPHYFLAQTVEMSLNIQPTPALFLNGQSVFPEQSATDSFPGGVGGDFNFSNPNESFIQVTFFPDTTQSALDFFIDSYEESAVIAANPLPTGKNIIGGLVYNVRAFLGRTQIFTFDNPFTVIISYLDSQIIGIDEGLLNIYFFDESQNVWILFPDVTRDPANNTISILTDHLTLFVLLVDTLVVVPSVFLGGGGIISQPTAPQPIADVTAPAVTIVDGAGLCNGADFDNNGSVDLFDFGVLIFVWQKTSPANSCTDINGDGIVNIIDFRTLIFEWSG